MADDNGREIPEGTWKDNVYTPHPSESLPAAIDHVLEGIRPGRERVMFMWGGAPIYVCDGDTHAEVYRQARTF